MKLNDNGFYRSSNVFFWVLLAIVIRTIVLAFFLHTAKQAFPEKSIGTIGLRQNDYEYFLGPVDEYFEKGMFQYEHSPGKPFAGRMPGYSFPYMLLRFIFDKEVSLFLLFSFQIFFGAISVYLVSLVAEKIFKNKKAFLFSFFLFAFSSHTAIFDVYSLSESFSVSAICFYLFFVFKYFEKRKTKHLLLSGFFITWAVFSRPFLGTLLFLFPLSLLLYERKSLNVVKFVKICFIFFLPFTICESAWIYRNFVVMHKFIPLETSLTESYGELGAYRTSAISIRHMIDAWGGESAEFIEKSPGDWFHNYSIKQAEEYSFPDYVFNSSFNKDSLIQLKKIFNASIDPALSDRDKDSLNMLASSIALRYMNYYKQNNFFRYYFINPIKRFQRLVFTNTTGMLPMPRFDQMSLIQKFIKLFYFFLYFFVILTGIYGMISYIISKNKQTAAVFIILTLPWIVAFTLIAYGVIGFRYYVNTYPVFILFAVFALLGMIDRNRKINNSAT